MEGLCVRFYTQEGMRHEGQLIHEWLFEQARLAGIAGGTAFRASAGFGRHGLHEDSFFELAGRLPECIEFIADVESVRKLITGAGQAGLRLVYVSYPVSLGVTEA